MQPHSRASVALRWKAERLGRSAVISQPEALLIKRRKAGLLLREYVRVRACRCTEQWRCCSQTKQGNIDMDDQDFPSRDFFLATLSSTL